MHLWRRHYILLIADAGLARAIKHFSPNLSRNVSFAIRKFTNAVNINIKEQSVIDARGNNLL